VCASAVVMLDTPCSEVVWRVLVTHSIRQFHLHFPSRASPCAITFQLDSTYRIRRKPRGCSRTNIRLGGQKGVARAVCGKASQLCPATSVSSRFSFLPTLSDPEQQRRHPITDHEGPEGEYKCSPTLYLTSALDSGKWSTPMPRRFTPGKESRYPSHWRLGGPRGRSGIVYKISLAPEFDLRTFQPVASRYADWAIPAHPTEVITIKFYSRLFWKVQLKADTGFFSEQYPVFPEIDLI